MRKTPTLRLIMSLVSVSVHMETVDLDIRWATIREDVPVPITILEGVLEPEQDGEQG